MAAEFFLDTNIVLYAASKDPADVEKKRIARRLMEKESTGLSAQVLQEFVAAAVVKKRLGINDDEAAEAVKAFLDFPIVSITGELVLHALEIRKRYQLSYWDAAIVAAAVELECGHILSEDFNHGQVYEGVMARNPFR